MIDKKQATKIASQHLEANPLPTSDYRWTITTPKEHEEGWVFEYIYECLIDLPSEEWDSFGGAPGFVVHKENGTIRDMGWSEMNDAAK